VRGFGGLFAGVLLAVLVFGGAGASARPAGLQHMTLIGDSVADALALDSQAVRIVSQGVTADLEVAPCRRLEGMGCPVNGVRPPSAVQLIQSLGSKIGPNVVMATGYNDYEDQFPGDIADALAALKAAGVEHVFWLTLRAAHHPYITMNADIESAASENPMVTVVDWNLYSRSHPEWFQSDGVHLVHAGSVAMATLIHTALAAGGITSPPVRIATTSIPVAKRGHAYRARLVARSGTAPYRWSLLERAPAGIHLRANGVVDGSPKAKPGRYTFNVEVHDAAGYLAERRLTLRVAA